jgi:hypothetical protein
MLHRASLSVQRAFLAVLFFGMAVSASALDLTWVARGSILAILEDNGMEGDPMPILPSFGGGIELEMTSAPGFYFEPSLDVYGTYYGYSYTLDRAVPYAIENRSSLVIGFILGASSGYHFRLPNGFVLRGFAGPAFDLRLCLVAGGLEGDDKEDAASQTSDIASYFWSSGRWFIPTAGVGVDFPVFDGLMLGAELRAWFPVYKLWSGEDLPAKEGWRIAATLRIIFR